VTAGDSPVRAGWGWHGGFADCPGESGFCSEDWEKKKLLQSFLDAACKMLICGFIAVIALKKDWRKLLRNDMVAFQTMLKFVTAVPKIVKRSSCRAGLDRCYSQKAAIVIHAMTSKPKQKCSLSLHTKESFS
jgi:hypothetical protein